MTIIKYFYKKSTIKRKVLDIKDDIKTLIKQNCTENIFIMHYGAYDIDPRHLVYWICVKTDKMKAELAGNEKLNYNLRQVLTKNEYPKDAHDNVFIGFESQETVDRESKGNWWVHFK
jgi:hypothetical protein